MKKMLGGMVMCFSMYSIFPVGKAKWEKENMAYMFGFLPLLGLLIGGLEYLWLQFSYQRGINVLLYSSVAAMLPTALSGGIHVDGLMDSCDAIGSHGSVEKRLEILKDSHVGAVGVLACVLYFMLTMGVFSQIFTNSPSWELIILPFALSRAVSALVALCFKSAKTSGLQQNFAKNSEKGLVTGALLLWILALSALLLYRNFFIGAATALALGLFLWFFYFYTKKYFGGVNGDLAGFSMCAAELIILAVVALI